MALQTLGTRISRPCDTAVAANLIVAASGVNVGNVLISTAGLLGLIGVTIEASDAKQNVAIQADGVVQITAGGSITAGNLVASNGVGKAVVNTPVDLATTAVVQIVGVALNSAASGALVDVLLQPQLALN